MLLVVLPLAVVIGSLGVDILPMTVGLIVAPHSVVDVSVCVVELALTASLVELPFAFVTSSVCPKDSSLAMAHSSFPGTRILSTCAVLIAPIFLFLMGLVSTPQSLSGLFLLEVLSLDADCHLLHPIFPPLHPSADKRLHSYYLKSII